MASHSVRPTINLAAGRHVLAEDVPRVLAGREQSSLEALGWRQIGDRKLFIPIFGTIAGSTEEYLLRLEFMTARDWPPSAQFVNPATLTYEVTRDQVHLPQLNHAEVHVHPTYQSPVSQTPIQLICCSATLEYYDVLHGGDDAILWQNTDNFMQSLSAIRRAMASASYLGRHLANAP